MPAGATYEPIATTTLSSDEFEIVFSSIPSTYTDLVVVFNGNSTNTGSATNGMRCRVNGDTGTNYSTTRLSGNGTAASSSRDTSTAYFECGEIAATSNTTPSVNFIYIMNYANTTTHKIILTRGNVASTANNANSVVWRSTNAITSVTLSRDFTTNKIKSGSTATLYGILGA